MTEPVPTSAPVTPTASTEGFFEAKVSDLARFLKLVMGRSSGSPPFPAVDLSYVLGENGSASFLRSEHRDKGSKFSVKAEWAGIAQGVGPAPFECAANPVGHLLDYLDGGLFPSDSNIRFRLDGASGAPKLYLTNGVRSASMAASAVSEIPRPAAPGVVGSPYIGGGPGGAFLVTDPKKAPEMTGENSPRAAWPSWADKGYSVGLLPVKEASTLLSAGSTLVSHGLKGALLTFEFGAKGVEVVCHDPKKADSDAVRLGGLEGLEVVGTTMDQYSVLFANVEPFLASLSLLKVEKVAVVHHPLEMRMNLVAVETIEGRPNLRFTQTVMLHADPSQKKKA